MITQQSETVVTETDLGKLREVAKSLRASHHPFRQYAGNLEAELERARVVSPADVPPDVVTMNSTVRIREQRSREPEEFTGDLGHIKGALLVPLDALASRLPKLAGYMDRDVVMVCRAGARSATASAILSQAGFRRAVNLTGGMLAWTAAGLPVQR